MKPENMLVKGECVKIADFGLGRYLKSHNKNLTQGVVTFPY
jgi:serine/threonine protein kinase